MRFVILDKGAINKYLDRLVVYVNDISTVIDIVSDIVSSTKCGEVTIKVEDKRVVSDVFYAICNVASLWCEEDDNYDRIVIKINDIKNLREELYKILHGFKIVEEFKVYGIDPSTEMIIDVCGKGIRFEVELGS